MAQFATYPSLKGRTAFITGGASGIGACFVAKFHALTDRVTDRDRATAIERAVVGLRDLADVGNLIDLLAPPVAGALD